jgi:hypothetical protein
MVSYPESLGLLRPTYQHVLLGMQAEAARTFEKLIKEQQAGTAGRRAGRRTS